MRILLLILLISQVFCLCIGSAPKHSQTGSKENHIDPYAMITDGLRLLKDGDLIVRLNEDPTSQFIKNFNRHDKSYSHAGIVLFENGYPYVYHIVNGEESPDEKLRKDSLAGFCNPRKNIAYGIFRYNLGQDEIKSLKHIVHCWQREGVQFDSAFNLATDKRMYCSEMIAKALARATNKRITIDRTKLTTTEARVFSTYLHLPFSYTRNLELVAIDNLYKTESCYSVREYNYREHH